MAPKRPPMLDLACRRPWPALSVQLEAEAAAARMQDRGEAEFRVLTWNAWFGDLLRHDRHLEVVRQTLAAAPDVVCFQEVLPGFADVLRGCAALLEVYAISPQSVKPYGVVMLVRKSLEPAFESEALPTRMGRTLLYAVCRSKDLFNGLTVATTHLESLDNRSTRKEQLKIAEQVLRQLPCAILCGDFNFDDTKTYGDWRRPQPLLLPHELENNVLQEVLPTFTDAWRELFPDHAGYTFDGEANPICIEDHGEQMRYDRVMARGLRPTGAALLGTESMTSAGVRPSDHFGVVVDFAAPSDANTEHTESP